MVYQLENELRTACPDRLTWQKTIPTFHPESAADAADLFSRAARHGQKLFISGFGNNIDPVGKPFADYLVLKSDRLNEIDQVAAADFYVTVGAGYPVKEINKELAGHNLWFPFGATNYPGSFGGAVAAGVSGFDGTHLLPLSRFLLAVTAILPDSFIVRPGAATFKSVSGYDLARLFYNSWGQIGMLITMTFRVLPLSKKQEYHHLVLNAVDREDFLRRFQGTTPESALCRKIKAEYDPENHLPLVPSE